MPIECSVRERKKSLVLGEAQVARRETDEAMDR